MSGVRQPGTEAEATRDDDVRKKGEQISNSTTAQRQISEVGKRIAQRR